MVLQNFITLVEGIPAVMHFVTDRIVDKDITDPLTKQVKTTTVMEFEVDELNGAPVNALYSVTAEKLAQQLLPLTVGAAYLTQNIIITKTGRGFQTEYEVSTLPRG